MPIYYQNPENALKRANEFCEIKKEVEALECLYDALKNRKNKTVTQIHENIVNKFLELCVELGRSQTAKDGLYSYRNLCQGINLKSWEDSICKYIHLVESKVENAHVLFHSITVDIDDLDQDVTPDDLLKFVSNECSQDREEHVMLFPSLKLLWECYRNCLDLLRYTQTDKLYHTVARSAFEFCVKYSRRTELRKLCNILRTHAAHLKKRHVFVKLDSTETQLLFLETGFFELESAINMELWQYAFKAVEDIHSLISISKKLQNSRVMAHYFDKISCIFWKGEEYLYHAAAVFRYFLLCRDQKKNLNSDEIAKLAARVLLSALSVPYTATNPITDLVAETDVTVIDKKHRLLSNLLDLPKIPSRFTLIKEIIRLNIIQCAPKEFEDLFYGIEMDMEPSRINYHISKLNDFIYSWNGCNLDQYMPHLKKVAIVRLLSMLSKLYSSIKFTKLMNYSGISKLSDMEVILVDSARKYGFSLKLDHRNDCMHFLSGFNIFENEEILTEPQISIPETNLKFLSHIHVSLKKIVQNVSPNHLRNENKVTFAEYYKKERENYHRKLLLRKDIIEKRKEIMENTRLQRIEEQKKLLAEKLFKHEIAEKERLQREAEQRNQQRLQREQEEIKRKILLEKMETLKKSPLGSHVIENFDLQDLTDLDPDVLFSKQIEQLNKERKELSSKLRRQERNLNHLERSKRVEEIPLLMVQYNEKKKEDIEMWKEDNRINLENAFKSRERDLMNRERLKKMKKDLYKYVESIRKVHKNIFLKETEEFLKILNDEKIERLKARAEDRRMERRKRWLAFQILRQLIARKESKSDQASLDTNENGSKNKSEIIERIDDETTGTNFILRPQTSGELTESELDLKAESKSIRVIDSTHEDSKQKVFYHTSKIPPIPLITGNKRVNCGQSENVINGNMEKDFRGKNTVKLTRDDLISKTESKICSQLTVCVKDSSHNTRYSTSESATNIPETVDKSKYCGRFEKKKGEHTDSSLRLKKAAGAHEMVNKLHKICASEYDGYQKNRAFQTQEFKRTGNYVKKSVFYSEFSNYSFFDRRVVNYQSNYTDERSNSSDRNEESFLWRAPETRNTGEQINNRDFPLSTKVHSRTLSRDINASRPLSRDDKASRPLSRDDKASRPLSRDDKASRPFNKYANALSASNSDAIALRPFNRDFYSPRPFDRDGTSRPFSIDGASRPFSIDGGSSRPFSIDGGSSRPFSIDGGSSRSFSIDGGSSRPFSIDGGSSRQFSIDGGSSRPFSVDGGSSRPFNIDDGLSRPFGRNGGLSRPFNRHFDASRPFGRDDSAVQPSSRYSDVSSLFNRNADRFFSFTTETDRPQGTITILPRNIIEPNTFVYNKQTKDESDSKVLSNKKSYLNSRYETSHSCTPWAKLKRQ